MPDAKPWIYATARGRVHFKGSRGPNIPEIPQGIRRGRTYSAPPYDGYHRHWFLQAVLASY